MVKNWMLFYDKLEKGGRRWSVEGWRGVVGWSGGVTGEGREREETKFPSVCWYDISECIVIQNMVCRIDTSYGVGQSIKVN